MSEKNKEIDTDEMQESIKDQNYQNSSDWIWLIPLFAICFGGWGNHDIKDYELRERVAKLEGQMDMVRRNR